MGFSRGTCTCPAKKKKQPKNCPSISCFEMASLHNQKTIYCRTSSQEMKWISPPTRNPEKSATQGARGFDSWLLICSCPVLPPIIPRLRYSFFWAWQMARLLAEHQIAWPAWSWDPSAQQRWKTNQLQTWEKLGKPFAAFAPLRDKQMPTFKKAYTQTKYYIATYVCCNTFISMAPSCVSLGACWRMEMTKWYTEYLWIP